MAEITNEARKSLIHKLSVLISVSRDSAKRIEEHLVTESNYHIELDMAFSVLERLGVPRDRASTVANGIMIYEARVAREMDALRAELARVNQRLKDFDAKR